MRVQTPAMVRPPCRSRSSWPFRVSLIDSMIWRSGLKKRLACSGGFAGPGGAEQGDAGVGQFGFEARGRHCSCPRSRSGQPFSRRIAMPTIDLRDAGFHPIEGARTRSASTTTARAR